jgi:hypothetical protein
MPQARVRGGTGRRLKVILWISSPKVCLNREPMTWAFRHFLRTAPALDRALVGSGFRDRARVRCSASRLAAIAAIGILIVIVAARRLALDQPARIGHA